jgi:2-polyprenyl-6-methoxyphenol hydroxylase-like FAD-dependent oxidoreductase
MRRAFAATSKDLSKTHTPITIIGGGPSGLYLSCLLGQMQIPNILLEQQTVQDRFRHPQAHFLNTRTMELLRYTLSATQVQDRITACMPTVEEWQNFRFVHNMRQNPPLAQVRHPVDRPLQARQDANGILIDNEYCHETEAAQTGDKDNSLSPCTVGHLAQHTFGKILFDYAKTLPHSELRYNTRVTDIIHHNHGNKTTTAHTSAPTTPITIIRTDNGSTFDSDLVVAADGAHSFVRQAVDIPMVGLSGLQHLMNVHVTLSPDTAEQLHANKNHAMLYSVMNETVVAMVVCHSPTDYIVQIPFFPPFQTHESFDKHSLATILTSIFDTDAYTVQSARPWSMSALIAEHYFIKNFVLAGDAAHVFPPAGGFGMNTGLQDVHNLAWKLAMWRKQHQEASGAATLSLQSVLQSYENERRPIAQQNAALSVRNYQRLLQVTKQCYLNDEHPKLLKKLLENTPLLPAKAIFESSYKAALFPLSWLRQPDSLYAKHICNNLRNCLRSGAGLPLLFPKYELGFMYGTNSNAERVETGWQTDTMPLEPSVQVGRLLPHVPATVLSDVSTFPNIQFKCDTRSILSTSNLPSQVACNYEPTFVLLVVGTVDDTLVQQLQQQLELVTGLAVVRVYMNSSSCPQTANEINNGRAALCLQEQTSAFSFSNLAGSIVLVRPDSHVASICRSKDDLSRLVLDARNSYFST